MAVAVAGGVKGVKVKSAPAGVTVAGGVKKGRLAVAVVRPRGAAASGNVVLTLRGKAKQVKRSGGAERRQGDAAAATSGRCSQAAEGHGRREGARPASPRSCAASRRPPVRPRCWRGSGWAPPAGRASRPAAAGPTPGPGGGRAAGPVPRRRRPRRAAQAPCDNNLTTTATARPTSRTRAARTPTTPARTARCRSPPSAPRAPASAWARTRRSSPRINHGCGTFEAVEVHVPPGVAES